MNVDELLQKLPGVQMAEPPVEYLGSISQAIDAFAKATLKPGESGGIVGVATASSTGTLNVNLAVVQKVGNRVTVMAWIGKQGSWGAPWEGGLAMKASW